MSEDNKQQEDIRENQNEGREEAFMDVDRMINEGLGGGEVTPDNGLIEETTTDTMEMPESILKAIKEARS